MTTNYYKIIGEKIKSARKSLKISQTNLGELLGNFSSTYITLIESGKRKVSIEKLAQIAEILNKPLAFFLEKNMESMNIEEKLQYILKEDEALTSSEKRKVLKFYRFIKHDKS